MFVALLCTMAETFELTGQQRAVVRSWHGGDAEYEWRLHRQSPGSIARFIANRQLPWLRWWRRVHPLAWFRWSARVFDREHLSEPARHFKAARLQGCVLTTRMLASCNTGHSLSSLLRRVRVHLPNGTRIGLAGVGEGDERLTFPSHYRVVEALQSAQNLQTEPVHGTCHWIRTVPQNQPFIKTEQSLMDTILSA